jgi:hypothetical protein
MTRSIDEIAQEALPGWQVVKGAERSPKQGRPNAQFGSPDLVGLRRRYLGEAAAADLGFASASNMTAGDTEFVEMVPPGPNKEGERRVVIITNGKAVAIQG